MAHNRDYKPEDIAYPEQHIVDSELVREMQDSYREYAMSVIVGRALPDVRDGLKPVHRRILYSMYETGLTSDKPFKKSATCVGEVLGHYHPHGDASVYDSMVRLAQDFSLRYPLVEGHGNFGDVDGNPPAAYRYTEARMSRICNEMLRDIDKDTVEWDPNFDETIQEPRVLPSRFPNLLVNGSSGIAVGMATNIPPHNLTEVINAAIYVLDHPDADLDELMEFIKGPDFPTRGIIMGTDGIRQAYATGRGSIKVRARTEFEEYGKDHRIRIIVTELPYQVNKKQLIRTISDQVKEKRLEGISDLRDETDRNGMRIVIELKRDANAQVVLNKLLSQTQLQATFPIIMLALVDDQKQPKILSLRHILDEYLSYQEEIIVRRTQYDLRKAQERAHLLEGLLVAQDHIDEVIQIIRTSYDNAKQRLMERFSLDEVQAQAICDMRLIALQGLNREKLEAEYKDLEEKISYYNELLESDEKIKEVLKKELAEIRDKYGDERKTDIEEVEGKIDAEDLIPEEECVYTMTHNGYIKRMPAAEYKTQLRGGKGIKGMSTREEDFVETIFTASSHDLILFFTSKGQVYARKGYIIGQGSRVSRGSPVVNYIPLEPDEKVQTMLHIRAFEEDRYLIFTTASGKVKRMLLTELKNIRKVGLRALHLQEDDELVSVCLTNGKQNLFLATVNGTAICFPEEVIRPQSRVAGGMRGIRLREGDRVISGNAVQDGDMILFITANGYGKRTPITEYLRNGTEAQGRAGVGRINKMVGEKTGPVVGVKLVTGQEDILLVSDDGTILRTDVGKISVMSRQGTGVKVMQPTEGSKIISVACTEKAEPETEKNPSSAEASEK